MKLTSLMLGATLALCFQYASADTFSSFEKGYTGVEVRAPSSVRSAPDAPVEVRIDYVAPHFRGDVEVAYATEGGLTLKSPARRRLSPDSNGIAHDTVVMHAGSAGAWFLNVFVKTDRGSNAISVPVTVGSAMLKPQAASSVATPSGQRVIEMPAQETIR